MTLDFTYDARAPRVVFGAGALDLLPKEADRLGTRRALVLCTPGRGPTVERITALLGDRLVGVFDRARMHVPVAVVDDAVAELRRLDADCCVTVGGGSATGLGKAVVRAMAPDGGPTLVAIPTTYAGSEVTPIWGTSVGAEKQTGRDPRVMPRTVIYDPRLTLSLPSDVSGASGMNAAAHCVEALYAPDANPVTSLLAEDGLRTLAHSLPVVVHDPGNLETRSGALYGAWLAGTALGTVAMGLHHRLCHALGGLGLPHAETHAVMLPHVAAYNLAELPEVRARVARAVHADATGAADALYRLARAVAPAATSLRQLGMREEDIELVASLAVDTPYSNPRPVSREVVGTILGDAFRGTPPARWPARS